MAQIFFSYARPDSEFAEKLANDLRSAGVSLWFDQYDILPGDRWDSAVQNALKSSPWLLVVLSPHSVVSENVMDEVAEALKLGKKSFLFCIYNVIFHFGSRDCSMLTLRLLTKVG